MIWLIVFHVLHDNFFLSNSLMHTENLFYDIPLDYQTKKKFFFYQGFLLQTLTTHKTAGEGRGHLLFHSTTSTRSRTFRHLFATLHVRWLSHIFNRTASIYQTATRWDLPPYRISFSSSILLSPKAAKSMILQVLLFLSTATKSGLRASITWSVWILKCYKIL